MFSAICYAGTTEGIIVRKDSLRICVENTGSVFSVLYEVENVSNDTYYLWFQRNIYSTEREKIIDYFMTIRGDFHLAGKAIETNAIWLCHSIYDTFVKKIKPQERFTIQILSDEKFSECKKKQVFRYLDKHVVIVSEHTLRQYVPMLNSFNPLFFYKHNFVTIPLNVLKPSVKK